jgi:CDP-diacylglycerol---glycerol-3-phosphate 3-phosphatidyltransferase
MNLPNKLTIGRILLTVVFIFLMAQTGFISMILALVVFVLASLTDYLDGFIARRCDMVTDFGKLMDPIADKFLILAAFLAFVRMQIIADWMVVLIFGREVIITGIRLFAVHKGKVMAAERAGKQKTVSQFVVIYVTLLYIIFSLSPAAHYLTPFDLALWRFGIDVMMYIVVILTVLSGFSYLWNNRKLLHVR